ncbi:MAG: SLC26A/SulP transporter family protein [Gammaproteobacteria bacterium]
MISVPLPRLGDLAGGFAAVAVVLPQAMAFGVAVGAGAGIPAAQAAMMGLVGAAALSAVSGLVGRSNALISAPTGPAMVLLGGAVSALSADGLSGQSLLLALLALTALAGLFEAVIGAVGAGTLVKFIPYPVIAGFMTGSALQMIRSQVGVIGGEGDAHAWSAWHTIPPGVALCTWLLASFGERLLPRVPAVMIALAGGSVLFHVLTAIAGISPPAHWLIGTLPAFARPAITLDAATLGSLPWPALVAPAAAFAVLAAMNTLLVAVISDVTTDSRHPSGRVLVAQGLALAMTGLAGGVGGSATTGATLVALRAGGRRWAALVCGLTFAVLVFAGGRLGELLPVSVLAGIIVSVAVRTVERDIVTWLRRPGTRLDGAVALVVTVVTVWVDLISAIAVGVAIAIVLFLRAQVRAPVIHRRSTGADIHSVRARTRQERRLLDAEGARIVVYELRGNLFFATADQLYAQVLPDLQRPAWIILHLRRIGHVDLTGARILRQMATQLARNGGRLLLCDVHPGIGLGDGAESTLRAVGGEAGTDIPVFNGLDEALEYAEHALLDTLGHAPARADVAVPLAACDLCADMTPVQVAALDRAMRPCTVSAGETVFRAGEHGDDLVVVVRGEIDIVVPTRADHHKRLAKCGPGNLFGELAFLAPGPRAADAIAVTPCDLRILDRPAFDRLARADPSAAIALLRALGATQVAHQRWSTAEIRRLAEL